MARAPVVAAASKPVSGGRRQGGGGAGRGVAGQRRSGPAREWWHPPLDPIGQPNTGLLDSPPAK